MKPRQVLGKYFEVYGQLSPITPEAGKKRAPFSKNYSKNLKKKFGQFFFKRIMCQHELYNEK